MNKFPVREVPIARLVLPGQFRKLCQAPEVKALADSIERVGLLREPWVHFRSMKPFPGLGLKRVAAHYVLGKETIRIQPVDCTDQEAELFAAEEALLNGGKVEDQERLTEHRKALYQVFLAKEVEDLQVEGKPAAVPRGAVKRARQKLADATGVSVTAMDKFFYRKRKEERRRPYDPFPLWGVPIPNPRREQFHALTEKVRAIAECAKRLCSLTTQLANSGVPFPPGRLQALQEAAAEASALARGCEPAGLCPYCKDLDQLRPSCPSCATTGVLFANQLLGVPPELTDLDRKRVMTGGQLRDMADYANDA